MCVLLICFFLCYKPHSFFHHSKNQVYIFDYRFSYLGFCFVNLCHLNICLFIFFMHYMYMYDVLCVSEKAHLLIIHIQERHCSLSTSIRHNVKDKLYCGTSVTTVAALVNDLGIAVTYAHLCVCVCVWWSTVANLNVSERTLCHTHPWAPQASQWHNLHAATHENSK